ncbi:MAG TPA: PEP-CTERM sorting domain-containing protein [Nitrospira sp.]|nr:PEP-CTERM sorting domain-containing protein [Nitrospira sp.]
MKVSIYCSVILLAVFLSMPVTADAFSRRSHTSEVTQSQTTVNTQTTTNDVSAQAVPEPPILLLMTIALGALALGAATKIFRKQA